MRITSVRYRYQDDTSAAGSWIYRIMDCDSTDKRDMLCQCFVEVVTESESKSQGVSRLADWILLLQSYPLSHVALSSTVIK